MCWYKKFTLTFVANVLSGDIMLTSISCGTLNVWAVDSQGVVYQRIGVKAPSSHSLNAAWLPVDMGNPSSTVFTHIATGPKDFMVCTCTCCFNICVYLMINLITLSKHTLVYVTRTTLLPVIPYKWSLYAYTCIWTDGSDCMNSVHHSFRKGWDPGINSRQSKNVGKIQLSMQFHIWESF